MKMLMIVIDESKREELEVFLSRSGVAGYTEVSHAAGVGTTGPRMGSRAFPKTSAIVFSVLDPEALQRVRSGIEEFCSACGEKLRMFSWDVDEVH
jgi:hypothetical protein